MSEKLISKIIIYSKSLPDWQKILAKAAFDVNTTDLEGCEEVALAYQKYLFDNKLDRNDCGQVQIDFINKLEVPKEIQDAHIPKLLEIKNCENINALSSDQSIIIAPRLTIIYGDNGAGKSGYSRLLNSCFLSRGDKNIIPNIYLDSPVLGKPKAEFIFSVENKEFSKSYPADSNSPEFAHFACFDTKAVAMHLEKANEYHVIPKEMIFFERLASLTQFVSKKISTSISQQNNKNIFIEKFEEESPIKERISKLSVLSKMDDFKDLVENIELIKVELSKKESEHVEMIRIDPKKQAVDLKKVSDELTVFTTELTTFGDKYLKENIDERISGLINKYNMTLKESLESGALSFKNELLKTIGTESWKRFVMSSVAVCADETSAHSRKFPAEGDPCPLCLQKLDAGAAEIFNRYEVFLKNSYEKKLGEIKNELSGLEKSYSATSISLIQRRPALTVWLTSNENNLKDTIEVFERDVNELFSAIRNSIGLLKYNKLCFQEETFKMIIVKLKELKGKIDQDLVSLNEVEFNKKIVKVKAELVSIKHKIKFNENVSEIVRFVNLLKWLSGVDKINRAISTRAITAKQKEIIEEHFTVQYREKFQEEKKILNVNYDVNVKQTGMAGRTVRKLDLLNHSPLEVLSEGEQRAIALADFFTEVSICKIMGGIILDDPVNSMDHDRKGKIANRIVRESLDRQVVVFTHDIGFLSDLVNECKKVKLVENTDYFCHWIQTIDNRVGIVSSNIKKDLESDFRSIHRADMIWQQARSETNPAKREELSKQGFDNLRKTYEAFVIEDFFGGTVKRYDRRIRYETLDKIHCTNEFAKELSSKLGYCSGFVSAHLGADEDTCRTSPTPELLKLAIDDFTAFKAAFVNAKKKVVVA